MDNANATLKAARVCTVLCVVVCARVHIVKTSARTYTPEERSRMRCSSEFAPTAAKMRGENAQRCACPSGKRTLLSACPNCFLFFCFGLRRRLLFFFALLCVCALSVCVCVCGWWRLCQPVCLFDACICVRDGEFVCLCVPCVCACVMANLSVCV